MSDSLKTNKSAGVSGDRSGRLKLIAAMTGHVLISAPLEQQIQQLAEKVKIAFGVDGVVVRVLKDLDLVLLASAGVPKTNLVSSLSVSWGISNEMISQRRAVLIKDVFGHPVTAPHVSKVPGGYQFVSYAGAPLLVEDRVVGIVGLYSTENELNYDETDLEHLQIVANHIAVTIVNGELYKAAAEHRNELTKLNAELEKRVGERTAKLQESVKSLQEVCYHVAHDLRAPLRAMQSFSRVLVEDYSEALDDGGRDFLRRIDAASGRMDLLISDLLEYGRISHEELILEELNLSTEVEGTLVYLREQINSCRAKVEVECDLARVKAHPVVLKQILVNLLTNALKFVQKGATPEIRIWCERNETTVRLWVGDNGIGIAPTYHRRVFQPFERLHSPGTYSGTGIGLAIVAKGVDRMGGRVGLESELGKGSRFWIELPKA